MQDFKKDGEKFQQILLFGRRIWVLRDDLLGVFNGNKARKLAYFLNADLSKYDKIVSFGSSQSNAMQSMSVFAKIKGFEFHYVSEHLSSFLRENPCGNFKNALENGMKFYEHENRRDFALSLMDKKTLFIEEGVAQSEAEFGFIKQAEEIENFADKKNIKFDIFLPSGTGASAAFLAKNAKFNVFSTPCVADEKFLNEQILKLAPNAKVEILSAGTKFHFAKPNPILFKIWKEVCAQSKIEFDLIYDPVGFLALFKNLSRFKNEILYIHQGGILGNETQLKRYKRKFKL